MKDDPDVNATRNVSDFEGVRELTILNPFDPDPPV